MLRRVERNTELQSELAFSAIPALHEHYAEKCERLFELAARPLQGQERNHFRSLLAQALQQGFEASAHAKVVVRCKSEPPPNTNLSYEIGVRTTDLTDVYTSWLRASAPPYFGAHPDAKVMALARESAPGTRVLDIGAGTGRNALPLARLGLAVDAVELTPGFATALRDAASETGLALNAIEGDAFDPALPIPGASYGLIVASEVISSHVRDADDLREFLHFACAKLVPGGLLVCNAFLARAEYEPDALARQLSPTVLSALFTLADLQRACAGLPLLAVSDESCLAYERENLPGDAWPPTSWFEAWANGGNLFDAQRVAPCQLRWLVFRKT